MLLAANISRSHTFSELSVFVVVVDVLVKYLKNIVKQIILVTKKMNYHELQETWLMESRN